jgi:hypothetical protein
MAVSDKDRNAWNRQVEALKKVELPADAEATGPARVALINHVNDLRAADGRAPLQNDEASLPELGLHRIAVARGLVN